jgi:hypothetical protein
MGVTHLSGLTVGGVPVIPGSSSGVVREPIPGSRVIYVGSDARSRLGDGVITKATLFGTTGALAALDDRTNKGDIIYILPGHTENVAAADAASAQGSASGFSIIGMGVGSQRPAFTWTVAGATWLFDTAGMELANCRLFLAGTHVTGAALTVAAPITVSAASCRIVNNEIFWGFEADKIVGDGIIVTGDYFEFINNKCLALVAAVPSNTFMTLTGADDCVIAGNWVEGATDGTTRGVIDVETTECLRMRVENNYIANLLASSTIALSTLASTTGLASRNLFFVNSGILPMTASLLYWYENYVVNGLGEAGALVGTASA